MKTHRYDIIGIEIPRIRRLASGLGALALLVAMTLLSASIASASATNIYIAQTAAGAANGADCADALPASWFNNGANWNGGASQIGPGTTVHLCGTFTGTVGQQLLTFQGSGTSGNVITLQFESGAVLISPAWSASGAIATNGNSWLVINGGANGIIKNTLNGTSGGPCTGGGCSNQLDSRFIYISGGSSNVTVTNLSLLNIYIHNSVTDDCCAGSEGVYSLNENNVTASNNTCTYASVCFDMWGNNITISGNTMSQCADCMNFGTDQPTSGYLVNGNSVTHDFTWDTNDSTFHLDGLHMFPNTGNANASGVVISNNLFAGGGIRNTAHLYFEGTFTAPQVFNNVFNNNNGSSPYHMPALETGGSGPQIITNPIIVNNTFLGGDTTVPGNGDVILNGGITGIVFQNNIVTGGYGLISIAAGDTLAPGGLSNNIYENTSADSGVQNMFGYQGGDYNTLAAWQAATGQDGNATMYTLANLKLNTDGTLQAGSPAIGAGVNLANLNITPLDSDKPVVVGSGGPGTGSPRPPSGGGAWTAGSYESASGAQPAPPTGLTALVQ